jgi:hypothetical protein
VADAGSEVDSVPQVLTEIQGGDGLSLSGAGRLFPGHRGGNSVDPSTVFRWVTKGMRTPDGRFVRLEAVRVGARWLTSRPAVTRFVAALTAAADPSPATPSPPPARTSAARRKSCDRAIRNLKARGA